MAVLLTSLEPRPSLPYGHEWYFIIVDRLLGHPKSISILFCPPNYGFIWVESPTASCVFCNMLCAICRLAWHHEDYSPSPQSTSLYSVVQQFKTKNRAAKIAFFAPPPMRDDKQFSVQLHFFHKKVVSLAIFFFCRPQAQKLSLTVLNNVTA